MLGGRRRYVSGRSRAEIEAAFAQLRREAALGTLDAPTVTLTIADLLHHWLSGNRGTVGAKTWGEHERYVSIYLVPAIGNVSPPDALTPNHLRRLYGALLAPPAGAAWQRPLAPRTVRGIRSTIAQALDQAVADGIVQRNVARLVRPPKVPLTGEAYRILQPAEVLRFWAVARTHRLWALWALATHRPIRSGDVRQLRWSDVDLGAATLSIRRAKTRAGVRAVDLPPEVVAALRAWRVTQHTERLEAGARWTEGGYVFTSRWGTPLGDGSIRRSFRLLLARAGIASARFHDTRHTVISHLLAAGRPLPEVSAMAGHASPAITAALYAHAISAAPADATGALEAFYRRSAG